MIRWLINKINAEAIRKLEVDMEKIRLRQEAIEENFKKTRAYVGYHGKKKQTAQTNQSISPLSLHTPEMQEWVASLPPHEREELLSRMSSLEDGFTNSGEGGGEVFTEDSE